MTRLVIDASVAVKWVVTEDGTEEAVSLLSRHRLSAPDLLVAECANILWKKVRRSELTVQEAMVAAKIIQRADVELHPMRALMEPAAKLAIDLDHPAYDCIYLALAMAHGWQFVTADARFLNKARQSSPAVAQSVLSLEEAAGGSGERH
ncbi:type II toxin-antitoxin system VapC family toxin [Novosphingobium resinovorum]|uniref:type II toxin-antitoxin system VapC family toxin n=1 Tax=Novosphingobium resinovorum TaxID=158500 RepID=UPI002ED48BFD|nr:type II toxin-antitoxin system VapC family toxin [Novosphingobium resinovorum]